jgi:hypothetical protein
MTGGGELGGGSLDFQGKTEGFGEERAGNRQYTADMVCTPHSKKTRSLDGAGHPTAQDIMAKVRPLESLRF